MAEVRNARSAVRVAVGPPPPTVEVRNARSSIRVALATSSLGVFVKTWTGSTFASAPVKQWNGTSFVDPAAAVKTWNGTTFV